MINASILTYAPDAIEIEARIGEGAGDNECFIEPTLRHLMLP